MNETNTARLYSDFPWLYRGRVKPLTESLMSWGFCCDDGWFELIYELSARLTAYIERTPEARDVEVVQVKQKFGGLRYYVHEADEAIRRMIAETVQQSFTVCELTGTPGRLHVRRRWYKTLCTECAARLGYAPVPLAGSERG